MPTAKWLPMLALALLLGACSGRGVKPETDAPAPSDDVQVEDQAAEDVSTADEDAEPSMDPEALFADALTLMRQGKTAEAEAAFVRLAEAYPDYSGPQTNLGILFATNKRRNAAIVAFTKAVQANPQNAVAFNWLGILNREAGDYERARQSFEKAIEADGEYPAPYINLGLLYEQQLNQPQQAIDAYRRYREVAGENDLRVLPWIAQLEAGLAPPAQSGPANGSTLEAEVK